MSDADNDNRSTFAKQLAGLDDDQFARTSEAFDAERKRRSGGADAEDDRTLRRKVMSMGEDEFERYTREVEEDDQIAAAKRDLEERAAGR